VIVIFAIAVGGARWRLSIIESRELEEDLAPVAGLVFLALLALWLIGTVLVVEAGLVAWRGTTIGKQLFHLRVIVVGTGAKPGLVTSLARAFVPLAGFLVPIPFVGAVGLVAVYGSALFDENRLGWHDRIAHTVVVER
jgi:uncharacterized RDD family membrane protein YckC